LRRAPVPIGGIVPGLILSVLFVGYIVTRAIVDGRVIAVLVRLVLVAVQMLGVAAGVRVRNQPIHAEQERHGLDPQPLAGPQQHTDRAECDDDSQHGVGRLIGAHCVVGHRDPGQEHPPGHGDGDHHHQRAGVGVPAEHRQPNR